MVQMTNIRSISGTYHTARISKHLPKGQKHLPFNAAGVIKLQECQKHLPKRLGTFTIQLQVLKTYYRENALSMGFNPFS